VVVGWGGGGGGGWGGGVGVGWCGGGVVVGAIKNPPIKAGDNRAIKNPPIKAGFV